MSASSRHDERIPVAVLGATGSVGQRFVALLADHPWFRIAVLCASDRSAGKPYGDAVQWVQGSPIPPGVLGEVVRTADPDAAGDCPLVFSALDASIAGDVETAFAEAGRLVVSNARNHRMERDVPLVVPEINGDHLELVERRQRASGRTGAIVTNPNCSTIGLVLAVKPLVDRFGVDRIQVVTMQAEPEPVGVQVAPHQNLRLGVPATDLAHDPRALRRCEDVRHPTPFRRL